MGEHTEIAWCDSTFNPWTGCQKVSPGCDHCYAEGWAKRSGAVRWGTGEPRRRTTDANWRLPLKWNRQAEAEGRRYRVFCASLADVFDNEVPPEWRRDLLRLIAHTQSLDWLLLTKRIGNAHQMLRDAAGSFGMDWGAHWRNVWLGATVTSQAEADRDIPKLLAVPARVRFLSIEPMLGPINLTRIPVGGGHGHHEFDPVITANVLQRGDAADPHVNWIIAGGESGPHARPAHPDWFRSLRDQCQAAGTAFFMKQMGGVRDKRGALADLPEDLRIREVTSGFRGVFWHVGTKRWVARIGRYGQRALHVGSFDSAEEAAAAVEAARMRLYSGGRC